jgi:hypothetical protein
MQELDRDQGFFDWLRGVSNQYGDAMARWGEAVHDAVAQSNRDGSIETLLAATDATITKLVDALIEIGARHEAPQSPRGAAEVLVTLERLLGTSAELLREARPQIAAHGPAALAALAPRISELRAMEADVEASTEQMWERLTDKFGDPGAPDKE